MSVSNCFPAFIVSSNRDLHWATRSARAARSFVTSGPICVVTDRGALTLEQRNELSSVDGLSILDENDERLGFSKSDVAELLSAKGATSARIGWYYQQLVKLHAFKLIPSFDPASDSGDSRYIVIDADTIFLRRTRFVNSNNTMLLTRATEFCLEYFVHMKAMHCTLHRVFPSVSFVAHHMMFDARLLLSLMSLVETSSEQGDPFWKIFVGNVRNASVSGASEYEMFGNYCFVHHPDKVALQQLHWSNVAECPEPPPLEPEQLTLAQCKVACATHLRNNHYLSFHRYLRQTSSESEEECLLSRVDKWLAICEKVAREIK